MTVVDNRAVNMDFNNQEFESGVKTTVKSLDNLKKGLNLDGATKSLSSLSTAGKSFSMDNISNSVGTISDRFSTLGIIGMTILANLTNSALALAQKLATAMLGLDDMKAGFGSYETKVNAIKTVMSGTGESIDQVTKSIDDLNKYSDRTIYSFEDMTSNISKFTNAGLSSKEAATAIQGISNVAAISGANTNEAARAMYNFGQALSQGSVRLMDWKSIENANMATVEFKTQLLDAAVALGTLKKQADGTYKTLKGAPVSATKNFNSSLEEQWLTTTVLNKTLADYASNETDIGKKANAAATQVRTFTQLTATLKDALKTGWTTTWGYIFGNLDEATQLFTYLNDKIGLMSGASGKARNDLLKGWHDLGGRSLLFETLTMAFDNLFKVMAPIKQAFKEIFPPITSTQLVSLTISLYKLVKSFTISQQTIDNIKRVFKGLFSIIDIGKMGILALAKTFGKLIGSMNLSKTGGSLLGALADLGDWFVNLKNMIQGWGFVGVMKMLFEKIEAILQPFADKLKLFLQKVEPITSKIKSFFTTLVDGFKNIKIDTSGIDSFTTKVGARFAPLTGIVKVVGKVFEWFGKVLSALSPVFIKIGEIAGKAFSSLGSAILNGIKNIDYNNLFDTLNGGLLAGLILAIKSFVTKGSGALENVSGILDGVKGSLEAWQQSLKAKTLLTIASAIAILAASLIALSLVDSEKLNGAIKAITVMFTELVVAMAAVDKVPGGQGLTKVAAGMMALSAAVAILSIAVVSLAQLSPEQLVKGLIGVGVVLAELAVFMKVSNMSGMGKVQGAGILVLAIAINILAKAVKSFGDMDQEKLKQGLLGIGAVLTEIGLFVKLTGDSKGVISTAIGMTILGTAMLIFGKAVTQMGSLPLDVIGKGLGTMAASLVIVAGAMRLMPKNMIVNSVSLIIVASALVILSKALESMGKMTWVELATGLAALAGSMGILALGLAAMNGSLAGAAAMLVVAAALTIFVPVLQTLGTMPLAEIGLGLLALAGIFAIFGVAGLVLGPLTPVLIGLSAAMALFGIALLAVGVGTLAFSAGMAALAVSGVAGAAAMGVVMSTLIGLIPMLIIKLVEAIVGFATGIAQAAPTLVAALITTLRAILTGITTMIPEFVAAVLLLLTTLLQNLAAKAPEIIQAGMDLLIALLQGVADNIGKVVAAAVDIVVKFLEALGKELPKLVDAGFEMIISIIDGITDSIEKNMPILTKSVEKLGKAIIDGIVSMVTAGIKDVGKAMSDLGNAALAELKRVLGIKSPSKEFGKIGTYSVQGFIDGISKYGNNVKASTEEIGNKAVAGLSNAISAINDAMNSDLNMNPSIRPVIDLTDIVAGGKQIDKMFNSKSINVAVTANKLSSMVNGAQSSNGATAQINQPAVPGSIVFNQINNSPKALSAYEIYRQTRNQLTTFKRLAVAK